MPLTRTDTDPCVVDGCPECISVLRWGLCVTHYQRALARLRYDGVELSRESLFARVYDRRRPAVPHRECREPDCGNRVVPGRMYCLEHKPTPRQRKVIVIEGTEWTRIYNPDANHGYVILRRRTSDGCTITMAEHRAVMEAHIGRPLLTHENIHHKNGDRADNRIHNLELWSKSQPPGQRVTDKLTWAREIIALYGHLDPALVD